MQVNERRDCPGGVSSVGVPPVSPLQVPKPTGATPAPLLNELTAVGQPPPLAH